MNKLLASQYYLSRLLSSTQTDAYESIPSSENISCFPSLTDAVADLPESCLIVSFDFFDTLVYRHQKLPDTVLRNVALYCLLVVQRVCPEEVFLVDIMNCCQVAETNAKGFWRAQGFDYECTLKDFATELHKSLLNQYNVQSDLTIEEIVEFLIRQDLDCLRLMPDSLSVLTQLKRSGKRVIIVSDTWYDFVSFRVLVEKLGILPFIDAIYTSAQEKVTKASGRLYEVVLKKEDIDSKYIFHFGDNTISDEQIPRQCSMDASRVLNAEVFQRNYIREQHNRKFLVTGDMGWFESQFLSVAGDSLPPLEKMGRESIALSFCLFTIEVLREAIKSGVSRVYFLARDGYVFDKLFSLLLTSLEKNYRVPAIQPVYLELSRAVLKPQLSITEEEHLASYLDAIGMPGKKEKFVLLVDIGWNGSLGDYLCAHIRKRASSIKVKSLLWGRTYHHPNPFGAGYEIAEGFAFDERRMNPVEKAVHERRELFELAACGPGGTVTAIVQSASGVKIQRARGHSHSRESASLAIQRGILSYAKDFFNWWTGEPWPIDMMQAEAGFRLASLVLQMDELVSAALSTVGFEAGVGSTNTMKLMASERLNIPMPMVSLSFAQHSSSGYGLQLFFNSIVRFLDTLPQDKPLIVYGAGTVARFLLPHLKEKVLFIVDLDSNLHGTHVEGVEVRNIDALGRVEDSLIIVTPLNRRLEIGKLLSPFGLEVRYVDDII